MPSLVLTMVEFTGAVVGGIAALMVTMGLGIGEELASRMSARGVWGRGRQRGKEDALVATLPIFG